MILPMSRLNCVKLAKKAGALNFVHKENFRQEFGTVSSALRPRHKQGSIIKSSFNQ